MSEDTTAPTVPPLPEDEQPPAEESRDEGDQVLTCDNCGVKHNISKGGRMTLRLKQPQATAEYLCDVCKHGDGDGDNPVRPQHYRGHPAGIECISVVEHLNFNLGNAIKYIWRTGLTPYLPSDADPEARREALKKNTTDLKKAVWYLEREIKRMELENAPF